ncbi:amino acid ABC transporter permease [Erysipelotrichaceae bacterium 51-3]|uniref:amino acid ABC transporter permease n=1 Tax=Allobaculum sp. JKK-2023 TaxID=3108943 RepID=UPI002B05FB12|nr:amino acid ABC transporter permease [Allobaculum sp. JKK-2023]
MSKILTQQNLLFLLKGAGISLALALGALLIGMVIGILMAAGRLSKIKILNWLCTGYVEIFRGTPMLMQIMFFYLAVPVLIRMVTGVRVRMDVYMVALTALSLNSGAYQSELFRSGIQGVDKGQWEACETLGIGYWPMMFKIILPQAFKRIIPPLVSEFITLIKDSSLASCIGAGELMYNAQVLGSQYYNYLVPLVVASVMYLAMTLIISWLSRKLERRMAVSD